MKKILFMFVLIIGFISCDTEDESSLKNLDLDEFTIQVPSNWIYVPQQGIDSYLGKIKINSNEEIYFDLGWYTNQLNVDPLTHDIKFKTIDSKNAKIIKPINFGQGTTGVYIDMEDPDNITAFQMSGFNLKPANQELLLAAIETLKFQD